MRKRFVLAAIGGLGSLAALALANHQWNQTGDAVAAAADACAIALSDSGESKTGALTRLRAHVRESADRATDLERLGWAYVAEARQTFDPGYYVLADSAARCLEQRAGAQPAALLLRGHAAYAFHDFATAESLARKLVVQRGSAPDHALLGDSLMEQGRLDEAREAYDASLARGGRATALTRLAHLRWLRGDLDGATEFMRQAAAQTRRGEAAAWMRVRLALYDWQAGRETAATRVIERTLLVAPGYAPALLAKGRMLLARGENEGAATTLGEAARRSPTPEYRWALIEALRVIGRHDEAAREEAPLLERGAVEDRRTFALYLATTRRDAEQALRLAREELGIRADVHTLDAVAWALMATGRADEARDYMRRALAEGTPDARLFLHAGIIAAATDQPDQARRWFSKAKAAQHMLLPSERARLSEAVAPLAHNPD